MRIRFMLSHRDGAILPIDYRAAVSAWIYTTIGQSNTAFAKQLHEEGYRLGHRKFKLFTYGNLKPERYEAKGGTFTLSQGPTTLDVSTYLSEQAQHLMMGLFKDMRFHLGSRTRPEYFDIQQATVLPDLKWSEEMIFQMQTPCCIAKGDGERRTSEYIQPDHPEFGERLIQNLKNKCLALPESLRPQLPSEIKAEFELLGQYRERLHRIHDSRIKGYTFKFRIKAPIELIKMGYYGGFGEKGAALGFGFTK